MKGVHAMSKFRALYAFILTTGIFCTVRGSADDFRINQLGYYPDANKVVPVLFTQDSTFELLDTAGNSVFQGNLSAKTRWNLTGDTTRLADFSGFKEEGTYFLKVTDKGVSLPVYIRSNVLYDASIASLKTFYYQRASMPLEEKYAGKWARTAGHPDTLCRFHTTLGRTDTLSSPGGWYDAGDFGKYVVNAGVTLGNLFFFYENFGNYFGDSALNIPESKNNVDDLLDEIKYELDWLVTMQDTDGGVFHKLTTLQHAGMVMPGEDKAARYFIGKSTAAALNFAAVMAMAGRVYKKVEVHKEFADSCINMAKKAWQWAANNPKVFFRGNPSGVGTGTYDDTVLVNDEFLWAASELFITTGDTVYKDSLKVNMLDYYWPADWKTPGRLAPLSLATIPNALDSSIVDSIRKTIVKQAETYVTQISRHAFRVTNGNYYYWGSNGVFSNLGLFMIAAYKVSGKIEYAKAAAEIVDYLLGKNAVNNSFLTGFGIQRTENPHHRQCVADTVKEAIPGFLVGGPSSKPNTYNDASGDYQSNEVAINWNGPVTGLFAAVNSIFGKKESTLDDGKYFLIKIIKGSGTVTVSPEKKEYSYGDVVTLTASRDSGLMFLGWSGAALGIDTVVTIRITHDTRIVANFGKPGEMVVNGSFTDGITGWNLSGAYASTSNSECKINITNPGTQNWSIQLVQNGMQLLKGATYVFKFDARSDSLRSIIADVAMSSGSYASYMGVGVCELDTTMRHFEYKFTMRQASDMGARITFNCGLSANDVIIDNVSLRIFDPSPVLGGRSFNRLSSQAMRFRLAGNQMMLQLPVVYPEKARLQIFDFQGRLRKNLTNNVRSMSSGIHTLSIGNDYTAGVYLIRYFDGSKLHTESYTNINRN